MKTSLLILPFLLYFCASLSFVSGSDKVRLRDIETLTLREGQWTAGRRSAPVLQVQCVGGSAAGTFQPKVVQCYNRGSDGTDIQWECKTDMSNDYRFGDIAVTCEGYGYPEDEYVLRGSCGLEYTLEYTEQGMRNRGQQPNQQQHHAGGATPPPYGFKQSTQHTSTPHKKSGFDLSNILGLLIVGFVIYVIYTSCIGRHGDDHNARTMGPGGPGGYPGGPGGPGGYPGSGGPPPPGFRPDDYQAPPSYDDATGASGKSRTDSTHQRGAPNQGAPNRGPGFWTGLGVGGLAGYIFGNRRGGHGAGYQQRQYGYRQPNQFEQDTGFHDQPSTSSWFGGNRQDQPSTSSSWFGGGNRQSTTYTASPSSSSSSNTGTRTASGFGGTRRR